MATASEQNDIIGIYYDLEDGARIDLEVFAKASIALSQAIREYAYVFAPEQTINIELESTQEGSFFKNIRILVLGETDQEKRLTARFVTMFLAAWFIKEVPSYGLGKAIDYAIERFYPSDTTLSRDEVRRIIEEALRNRAAAEHLQQAITEIEKDKNIKGVAPSPKMNTKPDVYLPRERFLDAAIGIEFIEPVNPRRKTQERRQLILVRPYLAVEPRTWRFTSRDGDISATMKDEKFLRALKKGTLDLRLVAGIVMDMLLETNEEFTNGAWHVLSRSILQVYGATSGEEQLLLGE